jgi:hypothetical protein
MQRLRHAVLTAAKEHAEDWAWLVDHSVQIGQDKCLVILSIRLAALPPPGTALVASDLELIALVPRPSWTAPEVDATLQKAVAEAGVPRVIVDDHGGDLTSGVQLFPASARVRLVSRRPGATGRGRLTTPGLLSRIHLDASPAGLWGGQHETRWLAPFGGASLPCYLGGPGGTGGGRHPPECQAGPSRTG